MFLDSAIMSAHFARAGVGAMVPGATEKDLIARRFDTLFDALEHGLVTQ